MLDVCRHMLRSERCMRASSSALTSIQTASFPAARAQALPNDYDIACPRLSRGYCQLILRGINAHLWIHWRMSKQDSPCKTFLLCCASALQTRPACSQPMAAAMRLSPSWSAIQKPPSLSFASLRVLCHHSCSHNCARIKGTRVHSEWWLQEVDNHDLYKTVCYICPTLILPALGAVSARDLNVLPLNLMPRRKEGNLFIPGSVCLSTA